MKWSKFEEELLKASASKMQAFDVAIMLGRTELQVRSKAQYMGVKFQKHGDKHHAAKHSDSDVNLVRELWELSGKDISQKLGIPEATVSQILNGKTRTQDGIHDINHKC